MKTLVIDFNELDKLENSKEEFLLFIEKKMILNKFNLEKNVKVESDVCCSHLRIIQEDN